MKPLIPAGAQALIIDTPTGQLRVLHSAAQGAGGTPAVLVHGGGSDNAAISWFRAMEPLARDRDVWAMDLPGFGGSIDVPPVGGPRELAAVVIEAMDALGVSKAVVFGVSMGGDVALNVALDHSGSVAGLVLIAPGGIIPVLRNPVTHYFAWLAAQLPDWLLTPMARLANRFVDRALRAMVKDPATLPAEVIPEFAREARHRRGGLAYGRYNQATLGSRRMRNDLSDRVHEITVPTLLLHGEDDPMVDPEGSRRAAARIPRAHLVMVPDCGHWAQLEAHDRFLTEAQALLAQVDHHHRPTTD